MKKRNPIFCFSLLVLFLSSCAGFPDGEVMGTNPTVKEMQVAVNVEDTVGLTEIVGLLVSEGYELEPSIVRMKALPKKIQERESESYTFDQETFTMDCNEEGTGSVTFAYSGSSTFDMETGIGNADIDIETTMINCEMYVAIYTTDETYCEMAPVENGTLSCHYTANYLGDDAEISISCNTEKVASGFTITWGGIDYQIGLRDFGGGIIFSAEEETNTGVIYVDGVGYNLSEIDTGVGELASTDMTCDSVE